jgi:hypothetical protein
MLENPAPQCLECDEPELYETDRRDFLRLAGGTAATLLVAGAAAPSTFAAASGTAAVSNRIARAPRPAEALIRDLYASLTADQRAMVVYPWNHGGGGNNQLPARQRFYNQAFGRTIGDAYTTPQKDLVKSILKSVCSADDGYQRVSTVLQTDNWNNSGFNGAAATIFGDPSAGQFAWLFTAHHLTLRCDGDSEPNAAFGGPMYYGHLVDGYSQRNVFNFQTRSVVRLYEALSEAQQRRAVLSGTPGENYESVRFRASGQARPGLPASELTADQRELVAEVMHDLLRPFRKEDGDEVMDIVRRGGGLTSLYLAFYRDRGSSDNSRWHFWRIEGPGFVWNYRILPHVHCFVNIANRA